MDFQPGEPVFQMGKGRIIVEATLLFVAHEPCRRRTATLNSTNFVTSAWSGSLPPNKQGRKASLFRGEIAALRFKLLQDGEPIPLLAGLTISTQEDA